MKIESKATPFDIDKKIVPGMLVKYKPQSARRRNVYLVIKTDEKLPDGQLRVVTLASGPNSDCAVGQSVYIDASNLEPFYGEVTIIQTL